MDPDHDSFTIKANWGRPDESWESIARRFARMLEGLAAVHPTFAQWKRKVYSRPSAQKPFCAMPPQVDELLRIFKRSQYYDNQPREVMPDLGFMIDARNGREDALGCSLTLCAGDLRAAALSRVNSVRLENLGPRTPLSADLLSAATMEALFRVMIAAWNPVWGRVSNRLRWYRLYGGVYEGNRYHAGWMVYLGTPFAGQVTPPSSAIAREMPNDGMLLIATREPLSYGNPAHLVALEAVEESFAPINAKDPLNTKDLP